MQRIIEFHIKAQPLPKKKKDGYLSVGSAPDAETPIPDGLELHVWKTRKASKPFVYKVPSSGVVKIYGGQPYQKKFTVSFMFKLSMFSKSEKMSFTMEQKWGTTKNFTDTAGRTHSTVGNYAFFMTKIVCRHSSFVTPRIPEGLPHSRVLSIRCNNTSSVEWMSRHMEDLNIQRLKQGMSLFEVVSVSHMGYYMAARDWCEKEVYYTLFYRMMRAPSPRAVEPLPDPTNGGDEDEEHDEDDNAD